MKFKEYIKESSLSRIYNQSKEHDSGTISAFRSRKDCGNGEKITKKENKNNSNELKKILLGLGYGVTKIDGSYIENYGSKDAIEVKEESYIVIDLKDTGNLEKDLIKLGQKYEQDSITYQEKDGMYYLISTNECPNGYPGNGKIGKKIKLGKPMYGKDGEFFSSVKGRPFVFENINENIETLTDYYPTEIRSMKMLAEIYK